MQALTQEERDATERQLDFYGQNKIAEKSKLSYRSSMNKFIAFLYINDRHLLQRSFVESIENTAGGSLVDKIKKLDIVKSLRYSYWQRFHDVA